MSTPAGPLCCRLTPSPVVFVRTEHEISRRFSLLDSVSGRRVSLHTNWWGPNASPHPLTALLEFIFKPSLRMRGEENDLLKPNFKEEEKHFGAFY